jgi:hypothetical protein
MYENQATFNNSFQDFESVRVDGHGLTLRTDVPLSSGEKSMFEDLRGDRGWIAFLHNYYGSDMRQDEIFSKFLISQEDQRNFDRVHLAVGLEFFQLVNRAIPGLQSPYLYDEDEAGQIISLYNSVNLCYRRERSLGRDSGYPFHKFTTVRALSLMTGLAASRVIGSLNHEFRYGELNLALSIKLPGNNPTKKAARISVRSTLYGNYFEQKKIAPNVSRIKNDRRIVCVQPFQIKKSS